MYICIYGQTSIWAGETSLPSPWKQHYKCQQGSIMLIKVIMEKLLLVPPTVYSQHSCQKNPFNVELGHAKHPLVAPYYNPFVYWMNLMDCFSFWTSNGHSDLNLVQQINLLALKKKKNWRKRSYIWSSVLWPLFDYSLFLILVQATLVSLYPFRQQHKCSLCLKYSMLYFLKFLFSSFYSNLSF